MKRSADKYLLFYVLLSLIMTFPGICQDQAEVSQELLDMKLELLNSKIELFNSQIQVWETKPAELEHRLVAVDRRIEELNFDPLYFNDKLLEIETLIEDYSSANDTNSKKRLHFLRPDSTISEPHKTAISLDFLRLFEGTFHITYERSLSSKLGLEVSGLATYASEDGFSGFYMSNQKLDYYNETLSSFMPYSNKNISGYGLGLKLKNYLLTDLYKRQRAPVGLYAAPSIMFRRLWLSGLSEYYDEDEWIEEEVTRLLNVYAFGATVGWKFTLVKVLFVDIHAGGLIRLSKYDDEEGFTKYKNLANIDFSGVIPTVGFSIGILK